MLEHHDANEIFHGRPIVIQHYASVDLIQDCQLLFVARSEQRHWPKIQQAIARRPILTVSDAENFATRGGSVQFSVCATSCESSSTSKSFTEPGSS